MNKFWFGGNRKEIPVEGNNISDGTGMQKCTVCCETSEYPFGLDRNGHKGVRWQRKWKPLKRASHALPF